MASGPLASLYQDKFSQHHPMVYPSNLSENRKGHWVTFTISNTGKSIYNKEISQVFNPELTVKGDYKEYDPNYSFLGEALDAVQSGLSGLASTLANAVTTTVKSVVVPGTTQQVGSISLYMPDTISIGQNLNYSAVSITEALGLLGQTGSAISTLYDGFTGDTSTGDVWQTIKNLAAENAGDAIGSNSRNKEVLTGLALKSQGMALNPQMELLFNNIDYRTFQFDFLFTPRDAAEAATIRDIIQAFKYHSAPDIDKAGSGRYFNVPSTFEIEFYFQGVRNQFLHKLTPSVLTTVVSDYAPQGWVAHNDGSPVQSRLTLQFKETQILTKQRINDEGY